MSGSEPADADASAAMLRATRVARAYCALIEGAADADCDGFLRTAEESLLALAYEVIRLPDVGPATDEILPSVSPEVWWSQFEAILAALADWFPAWPVDEDDSPSARPLWAVADDLADVWRDASAAVGALDAGWASEDIVWQLRWGFENHWGEHALSALRALHEMRFG